MQHHLWITLLYKSSTSTIINFWGGERAVWQDLAGGGALLLRSPQLLVDGLTALKERQELVAVLSSLSQLISIQETTRDGEVGLSSSKGEVKPLLGTLLGQILRRVKIQVSQLFPCT